MTTKNRITLLTTLAATPAFAAPFLAIGDNAELFLTGRTEARYEDNITYSPDLENLVKDDVVLEFVPGLELNFGKNSLTTGSFTVKERFLAYTDHDEFNDELLNVAFNSLYEGAKLQLRTHASYSERSQSSREFVSKETTTVERDVTSAGVAAEYAATQKSKLGLALRYDDVNYKTSRFTDTETYTVPLNYYFAITPKVDLSAGFQYRSTDVDVAGADSEQYYYNVGARGEFTPKLSGTFRIGFASRESDSGSDSDMLGLDAGLVYAYSIKTSFTLDVSNDFDSSSGGDGQEIASINVGIRSSFTVGWVASAGIGYQQIEYIGTGREDDYLTANVGVSYAVNEYMSVQASYNYLDNDSSDAGATFDANILAIAANFRY